MHRHCGLHNGLPQLGSTAPRGQRHAMQGSLPRQFWARISGKARPYGITPMPLASYIKQNVEEASKTVRDMVGLRDMRIGDEVFSGPDGLCRLGVL